MDALATMFKPTSLYAYTLNNPLKYIDPTGMATEESKAAKENVDYEADMQNLERLGIGCMGNWGEK